jgi:hypothetical protein
MRVAVSSEPRIRTNRCPARPIECLQHGTLRGRGRLRLAVAYLAKQIARVGIVRSDRDAHDGLPGRGDRDIPIQDD